VAAENDHTEAGSGALFVVGDGLLGEDPSCGLLTRVGQTGANMTRFGIVVWRMRNGENRWV